MTPYQIALVQWTWKKVEPIADDAAKMFYGRLFELDPSLEPLFTSDPAEQRRKLMSLLGTAVTGLQRFDQMRPTLRALGARHAAYGVEDVHYATVATALLWTLQRGLGAAYTYEVREAWTAAYAEIAAAMQDGATRTVMLPKREASHAAD